ncbi:hypothetical protein PQR36_36915 [Paraburkholderia nemoris]|uniref:hypothetical protein n=1 Tax=Paraburkholderia nemoris TaxID=2793076 RepID=UPI0038B6CDFB
MTKPIFHLIVVERKEFARSRYQDKTKSEQTSGETEACIDFAHRPMRERRACDHRTKSAGNLRGHHAGSKNAHAEILRDSQ